LETPHPLAFGTLLRRYRIAAGLTQDELAERAGISVRSLGDMERGVVHTPRKDTVTLLATALALAPGERTALEAAARRLGGPVASVPRPAVPGAPPLVGRAQELALLERHLWGEGPPLVLLAGEPGIGKSRLLHAAIPRAAAQRYCVLHGGCQRRGGHEPYTPILGALQRYRRTRTNTQLRRELAGCAWLVRLLPELTESAIEPLPAWTLTPAQELRLMVAALVRFLGNVAGPAGTLLVLDDLHWAGPDALDLLAALIQAAAEIPLRVIGAYRDTEARPGDPLGVLLADLAHAELAVQHTVGPLTPAEAGQLLAGLLDDGADAEPLLRQRVVQRAGGVPFFLVSYARGLQAGAGEALPWDLAQGLRQRVAALPVAAQELLGVAALIGRVVPRRLLAAVVARAEDEVLAALAAACAAQLLREEGAAAYQFQHDVAREVVEADLGAARRVALHRRIAEALERAPLLGERPGAAPVELLAFHFQRGENWPKALAYLVQAGEKAEASYAHQDALALYAEALAVCERLGDGALPEVVAVARKRGDIYRLIQHPQDARGDYERMAAAARRLGDRHQEGLALTYQGQAEEDDHEFEQAETTLRAALAVAAEGFDDVRQLATWSLAHTVATVGRKAEAMLREARELARQHGDVSLEHAFDGLLTLFHTWDGRFAEALTEAESMAGPDTGDPREGAGYRWALSLIRGGMGHYQVALALLHEGLTLCERTGEVWVRRRALNTLGWVYGELQDHQRALQWNTQGVEAAGERLAPETNPECEYNARLNLADTLVALGRLDEAETHFGAVEQVVRHPQPPDRYMLWRYAQHHFHSYGELWLARGDAERALSYAGECLELAEQTTSRKNIFKGRRLRGQALLAQGRLAEAERELDIALHVAQQVGNPAQLWQTLVARGDLRRAQDRLLDARAEYRAALAVVDGVAAALTEASLRETFLTSAHVQYIRQRALADLVQGDQSGGEGARGTGSQLGSNDNRAGRDGEPRPRLQEQGGAPAATATRGRISRHERQAWALAHLRTAESISPRAYARAMAVSVDTALIDLRELVADGLLHAEGTTKDRRYVLRPDEA
jgi:transcriptional regulator with XRE-family HTH domain/tetratricopeptide (TPR) repeat protein